MKAIFQKIYFYIQAEVVLCAAAFVVIITMFLIPPSTDYISYLDFRVLSLLFSLMAVVSGFQKTGIFIMLSERLLKKVTTLRSLSLVLILLCFFTSMLITNDVALITFVPFTILLLNITGQSKLNIRIIVLQTVAANLGSMLTPVGNPQNLFLYSRYDISILEFLQVTVPYTAVSFVLLCLTVLVIKNSPLTFQLQDSTKTYKSKRRLLPLYTFLFLVCIACVMRVLDYRIMLAIVLLAILFFDIHILKRVDYTLLLTFVCFFLFVGNMGNISVVKDFLVNLLDRKELLTAIISSQIISNVPAAALLSAFTDNYKALILGTDIGGLGTLVASLASLISYKFYCKTIDVKKGKYLKVFTLYNLLFLAVLCLFYYLSSRFF